MGTQITIRTQHPSTTQGERIHAGRIAAPAKVAVIVAAVFFMV